MLSTKNKKEIAAHSSIHAWKIPWAEEPGGYSPRGCKESDDWATPYTKNKTVKKEFFCDLQGLIAKKEMGRHFLLGGRW